MSETITVEGQILEFQALAQGYRDVLDSANKELEEFDLGPEHIEEITRRAVGSISYNAIAEHVLDRLSNELLNVVITDERPEFHYEGVRDVDDLSSMQRAVLRLFNGCLTRSESRMHAFMQDFCNDYFRHHYEQKLADATAGVNRLRNEVFDRLCVDIKESIDSMVVAKFRAQEDSNDGFQSWYFRMFRGMLDDPTVRLAMKLAVADKEAELEAQDS